MTNENNTTELLQFIIKSLDDDKIENIRIIELSKKRSDLASHVVIGSGNSYKHIVSSSEKLGDKIKHEFELSVKIEGTTKTPQWILIDLQEIMIHLFTQEAREKYDLEGLYK
jgi:ribosome-associated protein